MDGTYNVIVDAANPADEQVAGEVARALCHAYPGHPWHIEIRDGLLIIKHMRLTSKWAMVRKYGVVHDAATLKREVVMAGGEFLERAFMRRGEAPEKIEHRAVDGIPTKDLLING